MICEFITQHKVRFGVEPICRVLTEHGCKIAPSTYYAHQQRLERPAARTVSDAVLAEQIRALRIRVNDAGEAVATPESLYGARKTWRVLRARGIEVARCTVERVMRANEWAGTTRRREVRTTIPARDGVRAGDLLNREFTALRPDCAWVADFTYVRTWAGFVYVSFVVDVFSRRIIGWHASGSKQTELVLAAMRMATWTRARNGHPIVKTIHHSDAGSQYTSVRFTERLGLEGLIPSIGSVGDAYDNALMESTIGLYKAECIDTTVFHLGAWKRLEEVEYATAEWVDWYNQRRVHSALDYASPAAVEHAYYTQAPARELAVVNN
ncbi:IS3 family transposase [Myceligenerans sp. I2]|uniref:IS3 family transposase n=1 Tax=Myceligenerans indicum TaxID=2593663 RepID=A0ABS1LRW8_9MICO|nr:IS3 family transposase [Myceligenerans indicum]MBL0888945.1 IS3 family transposase [Myceligenerans indicum]